MNVRAQAARTVLVHRVRLDPNNVQRTAFARAAGTARFAWNWGLAAWNAEYQAGGKPSWQGLRKRLDSIKAAEFPWMKAAAATATTDAIRDLGKAFSAFFRRVKAGEEPGYPKFKKKGRCREGFALDGRDVVFDGRRVRLPRLGWVRMREALRFEGRICNVRVVKRANHWYLVVPVEIDPATYPHRCETQAAVGVDLGVVDLAVLSDGTRFAAPRALRAHEKRLKRLQRKQARQVKGSSNRRKTIAKLQRLHERIGNIRRDVTHKLTTQIVRSYGTIGIEDLNVSGMAKNHRLAKSVADAAMGEVRRQLEYKAPLAGAKLVVVDRWFPSSKTCSGCGHVVGELPLKVRMWTCPSCGAEHGRDVNAAINLRDLAVAQTVTACGEDSSGGRFAAVKLPSSKQEPSSAASAAG